MHPGERTTHLSPPPQERVPHVSAVRQNGAPHVSPLRHGLVALALLALAAPVSAQAQWELEESHSTASLRGSDSVGGGIAWASGTNGTVIRTEDGGYLWQPCTTP